MNPIESVNFRSREIDVVKPVSLALERVKAA